jgi:hypothetical protein
VPGKVYRCFWVPDTTSPFRLDSDRFVRPYWVDHLQRFCYPSSYLDFVYLGPESYWPNPPTETTQTALFAEQ